MVPEELIKPTVSEGTSICHAESLCQHLECLKLCGVDCEDEKQMLQSLNVVLLEIDEDMQTSAKLLTDYDVLPALGKILKTRPNCAQKVAQVIAELAKNEETRKPCIEAGLVMALVPLLQSSDQELLLHAGRAIGHICYENNELQEQLVELDVITSLVKILTDYPDNDTLVRVGLLALSNLADLESAKEALSKTMVVEQLVKQLKRAENHERVEIIIEVLQMLAEHEPLKMQLVNASVQETLCDILQRLQNSSQAEDMCTMKSSSDLIVSLLLGDDSMQKLFDHGCGVVYQNIPLWLTSQHTLLQMTGALAIANFARNDANCVRMVELGVVHQLLDLLEQHVENGDVAVQHAALSALRNLAIPVMNKVRMLEEGVANRIQMLLRSEMPPVQFKLLGTLRMLTDGQEAVEEAFKESELVSILHNVLQDESMGPEVKYNSMGLLCSLIDSDDLRKEMEVTNLKETLEKLCGHSSSNVIKQASKVLRIMEHSRHNSDHFFP
ncbi:rap1 GTPase-GDP dissociation stimulator 1-A-like isoform X2 [Hyla sarda]|uniref:rap1 GTPase-GDP dissociation stimulator 1-A-like isoform X2 n=1 Tax=Hyla sarda TaxID=327740 RepID=UPI0024C2D878|nr:rap1 GTPase-GDP dissociation stimulator 1-A-like isoform X2 [Hyla sarda]